MIKDGQTDADDGDKCAGKCIKQWEGKHKRVMHCIWEYNRSMERILVSAVDHAGGYDEAG